MNESRNASDDVLPRAIAERLAQEGSIAMLTPGVDAAVLAAARAQFGRRRRRLAWAMPAAIAATVIVAVTAAVLLSQRPAAVTDGSPSGGASASRAPAAAAPATALPDDVDGSGRVDILDAFALARADDDTPEGRARVAALAARVVSLGATELPL